MTSMLPNGYILLLFNQFWDIQLWYRYQLSDFIVKLIKSIISCPFLLQRITFNVPNRFIKHSTCHTAAQTANFRILSGHFVWCTILVFICLIRHWVLYMSSMVLFYGYAVNNLIWHRFNFSWFLFIRMI